MIKNLFCVLLLAVPVVAQTCGINHTSTPHAPTSDYPPPQSPAGASAVPAIGGTYTDPWTSCISTRLGNGILRDSPNTFGEKIEYANIPACSTDDQYCLLKKSTSHREIVDTSGNIIVPTSSFAALDNQIQTDSHLIWSSNAHDLYAIASTVGSAITFAQVWKLTFSNTGCAPNCTFTKTIVADILSDWNATTPTTTQVQTPGGEGGGLSDDGNHLLIAGVASTSGWTLVCSYQISPWSKLGCLNIQTFNNGVMDNAQWWVNNIVFLSGTAGIHPGVVQFSQDFTTNIGSLPGDADSHSCWTQDSSGHGWGFQADSNAQVCGPKGVKRWDQNNIIAGPTCVLNGLPNAGDMHVSCKGGWLVTVTTDLFTSNSLPQPCSTDSFPLSGLTSSLGNCSTSTIWSSLWANHTNEISILNINNPSQILDFVQHRAFQCVVGQTSCGGSGNYWRQPFASINRSGHLIVYNGDFGQNSTATYKLYADAWLLHVPVAMPVVTTVILPNGAVGEAYFVPLQATGGTPPYTWAKVWTLPAGLTLSSAGLLSGTPITATSGASTGTVTATDSLSVSSNPQSESLTINSRLTLTPFTLPTCTVGVFCSMTLRWTGGLSPFSFSVVSGAMSPCPTPTNGMCQDPNNGSITGTPVAAGTQVFTSEISDPGITNCTGANSPACNSYSLITVPAFTYVSPTFIPTMVENTTITPINVVTSGGSGTPTCALASGAFPAGVVLGGCTISGTPALGSSGPYSVVIQVTDTGGTGQVVTSGTLNWSVQTGLSFTTTSCPNGIINQPYSCTLTANGGIPPYVFSIASGAIPPGTIVSGNLILGTPTALGTYIFMPQVADSENPAKMAGPSGPFTVVISPASSTSLKIQMLGNVTIGGNVQIVSH